MTLQQILLKQAMGLLLTGKQITAQEAYRMGLVNDVVPAAELMAAAERWANEIMECSPLSVRLTKEATMAGLNLPVEEAMRADQPRLERLLASEDFYVGVYPLSEGIVQACGQGGERQAEKNNLVLVSGNGEVLNYHSTTILSKHPA